MEIIISSTFIIGYILIAFEHKININKAAVALLTGVLCWTFFILSSTDAVIISEKLTEHLGEISGILFFLMGAMTIVELIDAHDGFEVITKTITTVNKRKLIWIVGFLTFFLSTRQVGKAMLITAGILLLIGAGVCSMAPFNFNMH